MLNTDQCKEVKGEIIAIMTYEDGTSETLSERLNLDSETVPNLIVEQASVWLASLAMGHVNSVKASYIGIGTGVGNGTLQVPQDPVATASRLRSELRRNPVSISYYTGSGSIKCKYGSGRTNMIDISVTFDKDQAVNAAITEMGIFGGLGVSSSIDTGDMINMKTFPVWNKPEGATLSFTWRLTF